MTCRLEDTPGYGFKVVDPGELPAEWKDRRPSAYMRTLSAFLVSGAELVEVDVVNLSAAAHGFRKAIRKAGLEGRVRAFRRDNRMFLGLVAP